MAEVVAIHGTVLKGAPVADVVTELENALEAARRGEVVAIALATVKANTVVGTAWAGSAGTRYPLGAVISMLNTRYSTMLLED